MINLRLGSYELLEEIGKGGMAGGTSKAEEAVLRRDVGPLVHRGFLGMHRAHVDDAAAVVLLIHGLQRRAGGEEGAVQVHGHQLLPGGKLQLVDGGEELAEPGSGLRRDRDDPGGGVGGAAARREKTQ